MSNSTRIEEPRWQKFHGGLSCDERAQFGERGLRVRDSRRDGDRRSWADMEGPEARMGPLEHGGSNDCMHSMQGRAHAAARLPASASDVREGSISRIGASSSLEAFPRRDSGGPSCESPQRAQARQQAGEPGDGYSERERQARRSGPAGWTMRQSDGMREPQRETDNGASPGHPIQKECRPEAERDREGIRSCTSDGLRNLQRHQAQLWMICCGESARIPGQRGRLSDYAWSFKQHPDEPLGGGA